MAFTDPTTGVRIIKEGIMPVKITLTDTCDVGDLIGYEGVTDDEWQRADADGKVLAQLVAGERCKASGDEITCYKMAYVDFGSSCSATTGDMVYLSNTAGSYASTPGSWVMQCVGECVSTQLAFIHPSCSPVSAYAPTGTSWAGYFRSELESGRTGTNVWGGVRIDFKSIATGVLGGDAYGLYVFEQLQLVPTGSSAIVRLEDGASSSCGVDAYIWFITGTGDPPDYLFICGPLDDPTNGAWSTAGTTKSGAAAGYLKIQCGSTTKYINLWTS